MSLFDETTPESQPQKEPGRITSLPEQFQYVVIEGVIGAGKTALAQIIAEQFGGRMILERFDENPFLERFYMDRRRWAFQTQLSFLASRFRQQQSLGGRDLFHQLVVSDYTFDKDRIFGRVNLDGDELGLYETMYGIMHPTTPTPDLVVYLQSTTERLMANIRARGRSYERNMDSDYVETLNRAYNQYFFHYHTSPLLIVNSTNIDFVNNPPDLEELLIQIRSLTHPGTTYFNPSPARTPLL